MNISLFFPRQYIVSTRLYGEYEVQSTRLYGEYEIVAGELYKLDIIIVSNECDVGDDSSKNCQSQFCDKSQECEAIVYCGFDPKDTKLKAAVCHPNDKAC
ncbi:hypothetical protein JTE90_026981 [Oedothorax gibbosus]|uniref:Uncharacterized protein n=1 Tax=Oedothorax gibbosus TaxID=931172 RepID=A0AAV6U2M4_9ARAC|nr:hypothetical protein JTE90_026981 [Oedothorax gibbosus]